MEPLGERPVWSMSSSDKLLTLDHVDAELARLETFRLHVIAGLDSDGYAAEIGAHDAAQLLEFRYRLDRTRARRDLHLARALTKYPAVTAALPATNPPTAAPADDTDDAGGDTADSSDDTDDTGEIDGGTAETDGGMVNETADDTGETNGGTTDDTAKRIGEAGSGIANDTGEAPEVRLYPAQAEAIVSALDKVPTTVATDDLTVAEHQLVKLARHLSPAELRKAGTQIRDILDTDGPEPEEHKAYARESLTLSTADRGVKFRGYLANENAELLRTLIHTAARPHKTIDGDPDPRPREKRQADALTTALTIAATTLDTTTAATATGTTGTTATAKSPTSTTTTTPTANAPTAAGASAARTPTADTSTVGTSSTADTSTAGTSTADTSTAGTSASGTSAAAGTPAADATGTNPAAANTPHTTTTPDDAHQTPTGNANTATHNEPTAQVPGFGAKANITVTIDLHDLRTATADAIGDTVYGDGLSAATIRRLACDAKIIPLVLGTNSEPLDVGRSERLVTRAMRRALNHRDKGCVVCGAPPIHCDAHHLISWINGGETKISNLVLLCRRHHIDLHAGHWTITITNGQVHVDRPTWTTPPRNNPAQPPPQPSPPRPPSTTGVTPSGQTSATTTRRPAANTNAATPNDADLTSQQNARASVRRQPAPAPAEANPAARRDADSAVPRDAEFAAPRRAESVASGATDATDAKGTGAPAGGPGAFGTVARRSAIGRELLERLASAEGPDAGTVTAASLREAACLAIWGESATIPEVRRTAAEGLAADDGDPFDPWGESATISKDRRTAAEGLAADDGDPFDPWGEPALASELRSAGSGSPDDLRAG